METKDAGLGEIIYGQDILVGGIVPQFAKTLYTARGKINHAVVKDLEQRNDLIEGTYELPLF